MRRANNTATQKEAKSIGMWQAIAEMAIASMRYGQFPLFIFGTVFAFLIFRMPSEDVSRLVFRIFNVGESWGIYSSLASVVGWFIHVRWQRSNFEDEVKRIAKEKNTLQANLIGDKVKSSKIR